MKVVPRKFDQDRLYRHPDFAPKKEEAEEKVKLKSEPQHQTPLKPKTVPRSNTEQLAGPTVPEFEDEFGGNLFDGVEIINFGAVGSVSNVWGVLLATIHKR